MKNNFKSKIIFLTVFFLGFFGLAGSSQATMPTITNVSGTVTNGQTLTISGTNMVNEDKTNWRTSNPALTSGNAYGFEGSSPATDGWNALHTGGAYDASVYLSGSKSIKYHVAGACEDVANNLTDYNGVNGQDDLWMRFYVRHNIPHPDAWDCTGNACQDKMIHDINMNVGAQNILELAHSTAMPSNLEVEYNGGSHAFALGETMVNNKWYCVELHSKHTSTTALTVWVDGVQRYTAAPSAWASQYLLLGIVNFCGTTSSWSMDRWFDNMAISSSRVYPSSVVEISNNSDYASATKVYQEPLYLSDGSVQIKANLTGLGAGPYYLFVTNNRQEHSAAYALSGGGDTTPPSAPGGLSVW